MNRRRRMHMRYATVNTMRFMVLCGRLTMYEAIVDEAMWHARHDTTEDGKRANVRNAREFNRMARKTLAHIVRLNFKPDSITTEQNRCITKSLA